MNRQARKSYKTMIVVALTIALALSANVALAAHKLIEGTDHRTQAGFIEFKTNIGAQDTSAAVYYQVSKEQDETRLTVKAVFADPEGMEHYKDWEMWLVDDGEDFSDVADDRYVSLGKVSEESTVVVDNLKDFDYIVISRPAKKDEKGENPALRADIKARLPHNQQ